MDAKTSSYIDRKMASKLLRVSVRTIDRYIKSGRLSAHQQNGRIWLSKKEIIHFQKPEVDRRRTASLLPIYPHHDDDSFYHDLYEEAKHSLGDYQQKLQQANYRIGQLESEMIHRPGHTEKVLPERHDTTVSAELLRREVRDLEREITLLKESLKREQAQRRVFSILTYILLAVIPLLWYLLR